MNIDKNSYPEDPKILMSPKEFAVMFSLIGIGAFILYMVIK
jgi:hypothetical protein